MRNAISCPAASPSIHLNHKWLVTALFGLFAAAVCLSPRAAVTRPDASSLPAASKKNKAPKTAPKAKQTRNTDQHWQKKQPFAAISHDKKAVPPVKRTARQNVYDYRFANQYLPDSSRTWLNDRNVNPVSSVLTHKGKNLPSAYKNTPVSWTAAKDSAIADTDTNGYAVGPTRFSISYEKSRDTASKVSRFMTGKATPDMATDIVETRQNQPNIQLGMEYATGNGHVNASVNYVRLKDMKDASAGTAGTNNNDSTDLKTFAIGYTYDVSDRTSFYGMVARTDYEREAVAGYMRGNGSDEDSVTGVQFGLTHRF